MPRIDLPEDYSVALLRQSVRDSLMSHGEEAIFLQLYHASVDEGSPRCPVCYNEAYGQTATPDECKYCYGTTFNGGVKKAMRCWALFADQDSQEETYGKRGKYNPDTRQVHTEYPPELIQGDIVVRIRKWGTGHRPLEIEGFYSLGAVDPTSLRTGNRFGQAKWDLVGQIAPTNELSTDLAITKYPIIGQKFNRLDGRVR